MYLVVQKHLGSDSLQKWLTAIGYRTTRLGSSASYRLLDATSETPTPWTPNLDSTNLKRLHREWRNKTDGRLALVLDSVQTPFNVGSIIRTAAAYRVDHFWLVGATAAPTDAKTQKTALGSQKYLTWTITPSIDEACAQVKAAQYTLVGIELADEARPLHELDLSGDVCLALGHEDRGLSRACLAACDVIGFIPLLGKIGSLNVATAAAIAMYETRRQHWTHLLSSRPTAQGHSAPLARQ